MIEKLFSHPVHSARLLKMKEKIYEEVAPLQVDYFPSSEPIKKSELNLSDFKPFKKGEVWTKEKFGCCWFRFRGAVPESAKGKKIVAVIKLLGEGEIYNDGEPKQGLSPILSTIDAGASRMGKQIYPVSLCAKGNETVDFLVDCGHNGYCGAFFYKPRLMTCALAAVNQDLYDYYYDYLCLVLALCTEGKNAYLTEDRVSEIDKTLTQSYSFAKGGNYREARRILSKILSEKQETGVNYTLIGHGHLDLAWRWPIREGRRKAIRTFSNVLAYLDRYDKFVFGASQAQMFAWVKEDEPALYEKIKQAVKAGRIEVQGAMWTENDCNLAGGESLIRQFLYGERFFREEMGVSSDVTWLPDVFGFPCTYPQIVKGVGKKYFATIKLYRNEYNEFPYQTFNWIGPDGSSVIAHFPPERSYCASASPISIVKADVNNKQKEVGNALVIYGVSDGGGGPGEGHLEMLARSGFAGTPKTTVASSESFFHTLDGVKLPDYQGELYLEKHQGTYTAQAKNKYYNRLAERKLHTLEWLECATNYRVENRDELWKTVLTQQFHDILPGSSIGRVHKESVEAYVKVCTVIDKEIAKRVDMLSAGEGLSYVNPAPFPASKTLELRGKFYKANCPAYSAVELVPVDAPDYLRAGVDFIENDLLRVEFNVKYGQISKVIDKKSGKVLSRGAFHRLVVHRDKKTRYDAWDISKDYLLSAVPLRKVNVKTGIEGLKAFARFEYTGESDDIMVISEVYVGEEKTIYFATQVNWTPSHKMLRAEFRPANFTDEANCDIQFGSINRSTRNDTEVEKAQYEVCAHKYCAVGDEENGFTAVLSDCKFGYRVKDGVISLNLLRSPDFPDPDCDRGEHLFTYAVTFSDSLSEVVKSGYLYDLTGFVVEKKVVVPKLFSVNDENVVVETIKPAENGSGAAIRVYERFGKNVETDYSSFAPLRYETDLLERPLTSDGLDKIRLKPHEIKTYLI